MVLKNIKQMYKLTNAELAKIMECSEKRIEDLLNYDDELVAADIMYLNNYYQFSRDAFEMAFYQGAEDNDVYYQKHGKKIRERYDSEK